MVPGISSDIISGMFSWHTLFDIYSDKSFHFPPGSVSGILSDIFWNSIWHFYFADILSGRVFGSGELRKVQERGVLLGSDEPRTATSRRQRRWIWPADVEAGEEGGKAGRKEEGRKEEGKKEARVGRKRGREASRKEETKEGMKEGMKEGRKQWKKDGRKLARPAVKT